MGKYYLDFEGFHILTSSKYRNEYISDNTKLFPTEIAIISGKHPPAAITDQWFNLIYYTK